MLTLLTTTGTRQEAWDLCQRWMHRQTYSGRVRWIVVDDGKEPQKTRFKRHGWSLITLRPRPFWTGASTQARNLLAGLELVDPGDKLLVIEDDDWYGPDWLSVCDAAMTGHCELFGEHSARYFNASTRVFRYLSNRGHASLCATAMRGPTIDLFRERCRSDIHFIDLELWKSVERAHKRLIASQHVLGVKGLPGRGNLGIGADLVGTHDRDLVHLKNAVGDDWRAYEPFGR